MGVFTSQQIGLEMKHLDDITLESIAELICGSGPDYDFPGPYRSMAKIVEFFDRVGVTPRGESQTRKWFASESLQFINGSHDLERVLLRLDSPIEYRGNRDVIEAMINQLNQSLRVEGLEVNLNGVNPQIVEIDANVPMLKLNDTPTEDHFDLHPIIEDNPPLGTNVFVGHGHSHAWRELKDFLEDRLQLSVDEFNSVPTAGVSTINRLKEMMNDATFAFLVMTGDDENSAGGRRARMNVIHEAGLFQGRLGFERAIVLLEDGCEEFSNIARLGQIRFPKRNISAKFEEIRRVLEREDVISS